MIKQIQYTYKGMNQDITKSKYPFEFYYEANNIRVSTIDSETSGSLVTEKGNDLVISIPEPTINTSTKEITYGTQVLPYSGEELNTQISSGFINEVSGTQKITGYSLSRDSIILFTTDDSGFDCVWNIEELMKGDYNIKLLYVRYMGFSINNPIQSLFNYENEKIQKVYWLDGFNQLRFLNINHSILNGDLENLIDIKVNSINIVGDFKVSQPEVIEVSSGGIHTAGMIQYAYNLYRLNGAQSIISPLSNLVPLDKGLGLGGGKINEILGASPVLSIPNIDTEYTHIKVYSVKYTSYNAEPEVSLIVDEEVSNYINYKVFDDGNIISTISTSEFLFLGSNPFIPRHVTSKDNRLFTAHITEQPYSLEIDFRAYSFNNSGGARIWDENGTNLVVSSPEYNVPTKHDAINKDYENYKYQQNGTILGGEGKYIKYSLPQTSEYQLNGNLKDLKFFKDREIYRIGIQLYNSKGQVNATTWIADFIAPDGNLTGKYNTLKVELKDEFYTYIASLNLSDENQPTGYKIVRANRELTDKTILTQGPLNGMIVQTTTEPRNYNRWAKTNNRYDESKNKVKFPCPILRDFNNSIFPLNDYNHLELLNTKEIYQNTTDKNSSFRLQTSWQFNTMMQMVSPEVLFGNVTFGSSLKLSIKGLSQLQKTEVWFKTIKVNDLNVTTNKVAILNSSYFEVVDNGNKAGEWGLLAQANNQDGDSSGNKDYDMKFLNIHKPFSNFIPSSYETEIYGSPEITERGQGVNSYNSDNEYQYTNSYENIISDTRDKRKAGYDPDLGMTGVNSFGIRCVTLVQGTPTMQGNQRKSLDRLYTDAGFTNQKGILIGEIKRDDNYLYEGNIYGGRTYEQKSRTGYIEIGSYQSIAENVIDIHSPGDTFVQTLSVARTSKTDTEVYSVRKMQVTEIIDVKVETSINLLNRNDFSIYGWDNKFQPRYEEYHEYNRVYSQNKSLIQRQSDLFKFKQVNNFDNRIISSKVKTPGEFIDSWTDFLDNEKMDLDGKYGPINGLVNSNDKVFTLQDTAIAVISISPRVQTQGDDGLSIELGTGKVLHDYNYITTSSGSINKWSIILSPTGFYYYDAYNRTFNFISGNKQLDISTTKGMHSFFQNNINFNDVRLDNPLLKKGIVGIYDPVNDTVLLTVHQDDNSFTISYNEKYQSFESFYDYKPSLYISKGFKLLSTDANLNNLYEHYKGEYNTFYGIKYPSDITLQMRPETNDNIFTNINFKSEASLNGVDLPKVTLNAIRCWNEYQDSNEKPLILNKNISRHFRMWKVNIPREIRDSKPTLDRIRGQWAKLYLKFDNPNNYKLVLHDIIISYVAYPN